MVQNSTLGMRVFTLIWLGQIVSLIGSSLTNFALGVWVYQWTGSVTQFALISLFTTIPLIAFSPVAGALVDRWERRWVMILSDSGAAISTLVLASLLAIGRLETWHIYLITAVSSTFSTFQLPAYRAATTLIVPKQQLARANGMNELGESISQLVSPMLAGVLLVNIQLQGIIFIDFLTFIFSLVTLLCVRFPNPKTITTTKAKKSSLLLEISYGWNYIFTRKGLLALLIFFAVTNFGVGVVQVLFTPLALSFASPTALGTIMSIGGIGMVVGSLIITTYRGPQRKINSVFVFQLLGGASILVAGLRTSITLLALAAFLFFFGLPISNASTQVIFQKKVAPDVQGRVFALIEGISGVFVPLAYVVAGPLADRIFEPLMSVNGLLAPSIGKIIGVGEGRGIGLMFVLTGTLIMLATVFAYQYSPLRQVEEELPDAIHQA